MDSVAALTQLFIVWWRSQPSVDVRAAAVRAFFCADRNFKVSVVQ